VSCNHYSKGVRVRVLVFNATFNNISVTNVYRGSKFYLWKKPEYQEKTTDPFTSH
jgi:hypothetical protein